jgi:hypothetical protein
MPCLEEGGKEGEGEREGGREKGKAPVNAVHHCTGIDAPTPSISFYASSSRPPSLPPSLPTRRINPARHKAMHELQKLALGRGGVSNQAHVHVPAKLHSFFRHFMHPAQHHEEEAEEGGGEEGTRRGRSWSRTR